jgi:hypothetical protein
MNTSAKEFSQTLRDALKRKFGRHVTSAFLSRELDLFTGGELILSAEAVRRWMVGLSMPRANVVAVLESYLGCPLVNSHVRLDVNALDHSQLVLLQAQVNHRLNELGCTRPDRRR